MTLPATSTETRSARRNTASMSCSTRMKVQWPRSDWDQLAHLPGLLGVGAGHRLVEQQQPRPAGQRHAEFELALWPCDSVATTCSKTSPSPTLAAISAALVERRFVGNRAQQIEGVAAARLHGKGQVVAHRQALEAAT